LFERYNLSLNFERDWWLTVNGGSFIREIKDYVSNSVICVKYHHKLKNGHLLKYGLGYDWITDDATKYETRAAISQGIERKNLWFYNVKGISLSTDFALSKRVNIEIRHIIPVIGEKEFNKSRSSIGFLYKIPTHSK
jgi:hypothetical protein